MVSKEPILVPWSREQLAYVPGMFDICVDVNGKLFKIKKDKVLKEFNLRNGETFKIIEHKGARHYAHRLVALAWCRPESDKYYASVKILNGDTSNLSPYNLMWVEKNYDVDRMNKIKSPYGQPAETVIRNVDTGEVRRFPSVTTACEYIGRSRINQEDGNFRLGRIWTGERGRFEMKYASNHTPLYYVSKSADEYKEVNSNELNSYVYTSPEGKITVFKSYEYLFEKLLPDFALTDANIHNVEKILKDKYPGCKFEKHASRLYQARSVLPEGCNGYKQYEIVEANSINDLGLKINVPKSTVRKYLSLNKLFNGWQMRVTSPELNLKWELNDIEEMPTNSPGTYIAKNLATGEEFEYESKRKLASKVGFSRLAYPTGDKLTGYIINGYEITFLGNKRVDLSTNNKKSKKD